jgi:hypothetical protein
MDIWQNLYPENSKMASKTRKSSTFLNSEDQSSTDHEFVVTNINPMNSDLFQNAEIFKTEKVRWIVFKAKYRGIHMFDSLKNSSVPGKIIESNMGADNSTGNKVTDYVYENYGFNWPYDYFSIVELVQLSAKVDFSIPSSLKKRKQLESVIQECNDENQTQNNIEEVPLPLGTATTSIVVDCNSSSSTSSGDTIANTIFTQTLKHTDTDAPSPANQVTVPIPSGYSLKSGSVSIYLSGILQTEGSNNDYTLTNGVITLANNLVFGDNLTIKYKLQEDA